MAKREVKTKVHNQPSSAPGADDFFSSVLAEQETRHEQPARPATQPTSDQWLSENFEGQLAVDVYQTADDVVIQSTVAGVRVEDLDISVNNDMVTIRGIRRREHEHEVPSESYFYQECYWGGFSRSIILPFDVKSERVSATLKNGILTVVLPKAERPRARTIRVREEPEDVEP